MKIALCYPYIYPRSTELRPEFRRFAQTRREFWPGEAHQLVVVASEEPWPVLGMTQDFEFIDSGLFLLHYNGVGRDIGAHQHAVHALPKEIDFAVFCSSQTYFHREQWLTRLVKARLELGPGLYGAMGSFENSPHVRTSCFGVDCTLFRKYPHVINSREKSLEFESGPQNFALWVDAQGASVRVVYWDGVYKLQDCRQPANIFRNGDQSNCLTWDRHTEIYANADPDTKAGLEKMANGEK